MLVLPLPSAAMDTSHGTATRSVEPRSLRTFVLAISDQTGATIVGDANEPWSNAVNVSPLASGSAA
jgi:hypothetical protein